MTPRIVPNARPPRQVKVLVVDDDIGICLLLTRLLTRWGYAVRHVGSAEEALEVMTGEPADILLTDIAMPGHDGLWLLQQARRRWPHTAIVMITGHQDAPTVQASRRMGAVGYVTKPIVPYMLREALERARAQAFRKA